MLVAWQLAVGQVLTRSHRVGRRVHTVAVRRLSRARERARKPPEVESSKYKCNPTDFSFLTSSSSSSGGGGGHASTAVRIFRRRRRRERGRERERERVGQCRHIAWEWLQIAFPTVKQTKEQRYWKKITTFSNHRLIVFVFRTMTWSVIFFLGPIYIRSELSDNFKWCDPQSGPKWFASFYSPCSWGESIHTLTAIHAEPTILTAI